MKKVLSLFSALIIALFTVKSVYALQIAEAGETVNQTGAYDSTRIVAGNTVTNEADVDGLSMIAGNEITLEGSAPYGFYAGNIVTVNENIEKDMFVAGNTITVGKDAIIGRDAYIAGNSIRISTDITRDLRVGGTKVDLRGITIGGDAYIEAEEIILDEETVIEGKLTYPEESTITGLNTAKIGSVETTKYEKIVIEYNLIDRVRNFIISSASAFIVMVVLFKLIPKTKEKLDNTELTFENIAKKIGIGLVTLIVVPIVALIALFTGILSPLALITLTVYIISIYLSSLLVYYIVGKVFTEKVFKKDNLCLALASGIILVKIIKYIPIIGGLISVLSLFYGLGLIFKFITSKNK